MGRLTKMSTSRFLPTLLFSSPSRSMDGPSRVWHELSEASNGPLHNRHRISEAVICLFPLNVYSGRRPHLIAIGMSPRIGERHWGDVSPSSPPLAAPLRFSQAAFSFAPDKMPEYFSDPEEVISGQEMLHTHTEGTFRPSGGKVSHICREVLATVDGLFDR